MKKTTKAAMAVAAAGAVLLGGSGTLAKWTDSATLTSAAVQSGVLDLGACVTTNGGGWYSQVYVNSPSNSNPLVPIANIATYRLKPGFNYTYFCDSKVLATGPRLKANVMVDKTKLSGGLASANVDLRTYVTDQSNNLLYDSTASTPNIAPVTSALNNTNLTAQLLFTIYPADTTSPGLTLNTTALTIDVKQLGLTPAP
ncbi:MULTISPECIES: alternate-type signal peptide domain-containing protein [Rhodococcus]|uniref:alternate-type signal peptide domain-containing protein n=1 Tax=Rhodococcus TaxID=1827 RepID=UPI00067ED34F|nr:MULTISPECIES: alternate-type signal peptide domain-containing protein [Rhodococcus]MCT6735867.1 alternate-type signal peptide domain-containing protein [Rhodococcus qingshengii]MEA1793739.1 alternate-type signal peptide domain-containing protein [Rhodococcus qingshengii]